MREERTALSPDSRTYSRKTAMFLMALISLASSLGQVYPMVKPLPEALNRVPAFVGLFYLAFCLPEQQKKPLNVLFRALMMIAGVAGGACWMFNLAVAGTAHPLTAMILFLMGQFLTAVLLILWEIRLPEDVRGENGAGLRVTAVLYALCTLWKAVEAVVYLLGQSGVRTIPEWTIYTSEFSSDLQLLLGAALAIQLLQLLFRQTAWEARQN